MGSAENKALVLDWVDALGKGDVPRIVAKYHADLVYFVIGSWPLAGTFGREYMAANAKDVYAVFPEGLAFRPLKLVAEGDWVALDMESEGRHVSGRTYRNRYTYWIEIRAGSFRRLEEHLDTQHAVDVLCSPTSGLDFAARRAEPEGALDVAQAFFAAIERGDLAAVRELYAPDAVIWHAIDGRAKTRDENVAMLAAALANVANLHYEDVRLAPIAGGFVQQHVVRGTERSSGAPLDLPAVVVCGVADGRITRLDEYFDSAHAPGARQR